MANLNLCKCCKIKIKLFCNETGLKQSSVMKYLDKLYLPYADRVVKKKYIHHILKEFETVNDLRMFMWGIMERDRFMSAEIADDYFKRVVKGK